MNLMLRSQRLARSLEAGRLALGHTDVSAVSRDEAVVSAYQNRWIAYNAKEEIEGRPDCRWRGASQAMPITLGPNPELDLRAHQLAEALAKHRSPATRGKTIP